MPQVPFSGVPEVRPELNPTPRYEANVRPESFGVNVAQAIHGMGNTLSSAGNEMFARGMAMQDLYNHTVTQEAVVKNMKAAGEINAKLDSMEQKNAVDYYAKGFYEDLTAARKSIRDSLPNDMARKLYDSETLRTTGQSLMSGARHAGAENKKYAIGTSNAVIEESRNRAMANPSDPTIFNQSMADTERNVEAQAQIRGWSPDEMQLEKEKARSALWRDTIKGMAKSEPIKAGKMLDEAVRGKGLVGTDIADATNSVQQARNTVGARMISQQVNSGIGTSIGSKIVPIEQAAEAIGTFESGGRYDLQGVQTKHGRALGKYQVMEEFLPQFLKDAGMPSMTKEQFLASPQAQDQLFNTRFGQYMKETGSFNDAASKWFSGRTMAQAGNVSDAHGTTVTRYVAQTNALLARNAPLATKMEEGTKLASAAAPDDPLFPDFVQQRIKTDNDRLIAVRKDTEFQNRQTIEDGLMGGQQGKLPTTVEELTDTPEKAQAWQDLLPSTQRRYMGVLSRNAKGDTNWTETSLREYQRLKGIAASDPADFLDMDVVGSELPMSARRELINLQGRLKGKAEGDPRVAKALGILAPDLVAAGLDKRKDAETYYQFVGQLADQLQQSADENKRPPKADEIKLIGSRLLTQQPTKSFFGLFNSKTPTFQVPVPSDEAEKIKTDPTWGKLGITPTDQQIQRIYSRDLYNRLYGKATSSPAGVPQAPVSQ